MTLPQILTRIPPRADQTELPVTLSVRWTGVTREHLRREWSERRLAHRSGRTDDMRGVSVRAFTRNETRLTVRTYEELAELLFILDALCATQSAPSWATPGGADVLRRVRTDLFDAMAQHDISVEGS